MSKLLIHLGPPKTGTTQIQSFLNSNSMVLMRNSINYIQCKPKKQIRSYLREYKKSNRWLLRKWKPLKPWFLNCPESYFFKEFSSNNSIISEEALFKLLAYKNEIHSFDKFLSDYYSDRLYLVVLREINGHTISQLSQSIKGLRRFNYKNCLSKLKRFSLDRDFSGIINTKLSLKIATFDDLINNTEYANNTSALLEYFFGTSDLHLKAIPGKKNASLGAEGTAVHLAYNNIIHLLIGEKMLNTFRASIIPFARKFRKELFEKLPNQKSFCPYTEHEQTKFVKSHISKSKIFLKRYPGSWDEKIFSPKIRVKNISLISDFCDIDKKIIVELLDQSINKLVNAPFFRPNLICSTKIHEAVEFFLKNERRFVL